MNRFKRFLRGMAEFVISVILGVTFTFIIQATGLPSVDYRNRVIAPLLLQDQWKPLDKAKQQEIENQLTQTDSNFTSVGNLIDKTTPLTFSHVQVLRKNGLSVEYWPSFQEDAVEACLSRFWIALWCTLGSGLLVVLVSRHLFAPEKAICGFPFEQDPPVDLETAMQRVFKEDGVPFHISLRDLLDTGEDTFYQQLCSANRFVGDPSTRKKIKGSLKNSP